MNHRGQPFCFTDEEIEGQRGKVTAQGHTGLDFGQFVYPLWVPLSLSVNGDVAPFTKLNDRKLRESGISFNNCDVSSKSKGL